MNAYMVTLVSGKQFIVRDPLTVITDQYGYLFIVEKEAIKSLDGQEHYVTSETFNMHAWASFKHIEDIDIKDGV